MRRSVFAVLPVASFLVAAACAPAPPPPPAAPPGPTPAEKIAAANKLDQDFIAAFNKQDTEAVMALYANSPNLVSIGPDGMGLKGYDGNKASTAEMFKGMPGAKLELLTSENQVHGDVVLGWGTWRMTIPAKPKPMVMEGRFSDAKALRDGKWVYLMDHVSVPIPGDPGQKK
jgi:ketosteroid isomerase-like protein